MKFSVNYAMSTGSDISPSDKEKVLKSLWNELDSEGRIIRERVELQMEMVGYEDVVLIDGLDYAIVGLADYPHDCVIYDYVRCVEVFAVRDGLPLEQASDKVEEVIARYEHSDQGPIFVYPLDYIEEEEMDDYDLLAAHEIVFKDRSKN